MSGEGRYSFTFEGLISKLKDGLTKPTHRKPKKWVAIATLSLSALVFSAIGAGWNHLDYQIALSKKDAEINKNKELVVTIHHEKERRIKEIKDSYKSNDVFNAITVNKEIAKLSKLVTEQSETIKGLTSDKKKAEEANKKLEQRLADAEKSEPEQVAEIRKEFEAYKSTHPKTLEQYDALQTLLGNTQRTLNTLTETLNEYKKSHPLTITQEQVDALNTQITDAQQALVEYKKTHPEEITLEAYNKMERVKVNTANDWKKILDEFRKYKKTHPEEITQDAFTSLQEKLKTANDAFEAYKKTHPLEITQEQVDALNKQITDAQQALVEYQKTHPLDVNQASFEELKKKLGTAQAAIDEYKKKYPEEEVEQIYSDLIGIFLVLKGKLDESNKKGVLPENPPKKIVGLAGEVGGGALELIKRMEKAQEQLAAQAEAYKKSHSHTNPEYETVTSERDKLIAEQSELEKNLEERIARKFNGAGIYTDPKSKDFYLYFDITYSKELPSEEIQRIAEDWAGLKRIGRYITPENSRKYDIWSTIGRNYSGTLKNDFERAWVKLEYLPNSSEVVKYLLVVEKGSKKEETVISQSDVQAFVKNCLSKR